MTRFYGNVGYSITVEKRPGVWGTEIIERKYYGNIIKNMQKWVPKEFINDDLTLSSKISIIADPYAYKNLAMIRYVEWFGAKWKVTDIETQRPRIILTLGGVYNG